MTSPNTNLEKLLTGRPKDSGAVVLVDEWQSLNTESPESEWRQVEAEQLRAHSWGAHSEENFIPRRHASELRILRADVHDLKVRLRQAEAQIAELAAASASRQPVDVEVVTDPIAEWVDENIGLLTTHVNDYVVFDVTSNEVVAFEADATKLDSVVSSARLQRNHEITVFRAETFVAPPPIL